MDGTGNTPDVGAMLCSFNGPNAPRFGDPPEDPELPPIPCRLGDDVQEGGGATCKAPVA